MIDLKKRGAFIRLDWQAKAGWPVPRFGYRPAVIEPARRRVEWVNYPGLPSHPTYANAQRYLAGGSCRMEMVANRRMSLRVTSPFWARRARKMRTDFGSSAGNCSAILASVAPRSR